MTNIPNRLFKKASSQRPNDIDEIDKLLNTCEFMSNKIPTEFYNDLLVLITKNSVEPDNANHIRVLQELRNNRDILKDVFEELVKNSFSDESLNAFYIKHYDLINMDYGNKFINTMLSSYWFQIFRKTKTEVHKTDDLKLIERFNDFFKRFEITSRSVFY